jgi:predicted enzyme related to lactoylglutathione lyase
MITSAHVLLYTSEPEKVRAVFRDVFQWKHVDAGGGWLIFRLPPAELGVHPAEDTGTYETGTLHQFTLVCDDLAKTIAELKEKGISIPGEPEDQGWGTSVMLELPGGLEVMLYQPRHPMAP